MISASFAAWIAVTWHRAMFWDLNVAWDPKRAAAFADLALRCARARNQVSQGRLGSKVGLGHLGTAWHTLGQRMVMDGEMRVKWL